MTGTVDPADAPSFDEVAAGAQQRHPTLEVGTMMGHACLRLDGDFVGMVMGDGGLIVKLDTPTVTAAIEAGEGESFAPAGRVFGAWLHVPGDRWDSWDALLDQAIDLAR